MRIITSGRLSPPTLLLLLALAAPALADLGPEVKMVLHAPDGVYPVAGQTFSFDFEITSATSSTVTEPTVRSGRTAGGQFAWEVVSFPLPAGTRLAAMQPATIPVQLQCNDPAQPVEISLEVEGRTATQRFYLLPQNLNVAMGGSETIMAFDSDHGPTWTTDDEFARPDPAPVTRKNVRDLRKEMPANPATGRNIRVRGRFVYYRNSVDDEGNYEGDGRTMGADGVTVNVYDSDWEWDDLLAQTSLGPDGNFDLTFWYDDAEAPDIYVEFLAANNKVDLVYPSIWNISYRWNTPTKEDYGGSDINWGLRHPASESHYAGLNLLASATRTWRWLDANGYGGIDDLLISWPDSDWPHYSSDWETIYIPEFKEWYEGTVCHEYGHHWQQEYTEVSGTDYCNAGNRCDDPNADCRHCFWCEETAGDALREGFPDWISNAVTSTWPSSYGFSAIFDYNWESVNVCGWNDLDAFDDPWKTEGNIAAFLQDLVDDDNDTDPNALTGGADAVTWSAQRILSTQGTYDPTTPAGLIARLQTRYPESRDVIWMAAANARFNGLDTQAPSALSGLASLSHATSGDSPDGTVELVWNGASDGDSGINGYSVRVGTAAGLIPDEDVETTTTAWTSDDLAPGTYWFTVRAVDRAGNAGTHASFGPVTIRNWTAANLEAIDGGYWPYPVVPRLSGNATYTSAPLPAVLVGNGDNTFMNVRIGNSGELATSPTLRLNLMVDGALWWYSSIYTLDGYHDRPYMNLGPAEVKGGRHAVMLWADAYEQMAEVDEADNIFVRQFIWYPYTLFTDGTWVERQRPPDAWGGFNPGLFAAPNCDGFAFGLNSDPFVGAVMVADDDTSDFDLRLHEHTTGPTVGFGYFDIEAISARPAGCIEGVFVNNSQTTETVFDVGVVNQDFDGYGFKIRRMASTLMATGSDVRFPLSPIEPLALRHFTMSGNPGTNYGTVTLQVDPAVGPVRMKVMHAGLADGGLGDIFDQAVTDADGFARVNFTYGGVTQGLAVWQDPRDIPAGGNGHFQVTVRAYVRRPDFAPLTTAGWHAPLVPTYPTPGTPASTQLPGTLVGNATTTYINAQFRNQDAGTAGPFESMTYLDGVALLSEQISMLAGFTDRIRNFPTAQNVRGGRHTLSMFPDAGGDVIEGDETNNAMGAQYAWSPMNLTSGSVINRTAPPDPTGGFADVMAWSSAPTWYNCDGLRSPVPAPSGDNGWWVAVAALPGAASDVDLRLHEKTDSPLHGFREAHAVSVWGPAESDYVLVNCRSTTPRQLDVGAIGADGAESYRVHAAVSSWLDTDPQGDYGPFNFGATNLIRLYEVWLPAGPLLIELRNTGGDVDWGLTLHRGQLPYHAKSASAGIVAQSWIAGAGQDESLPAIVPQDGYYCLAIWKAGAADADKAGQYELTFNPGTTPVPGDGGPPTVTAVREITPNPFNPSTRIAFDLARDGRVALEVFDVRGRPVRRLLAADLAAGRHEVEWNGRDNDGNGVASGTYFARLTGAGGASTRKMLLLK